MIEIEVVNRGDTRIHYTTRNTTRNNNTTTECTGEAANDNTLFSMKKIEKCITSSEKIIVILLTHAAETAMRSQVRVGVD